MGTLKEHPFLITTSFKHDKKTITYDPTAPNRSTAVGKVYKLNDDGVAELPADGEAFDGVITHVDDTQITGAYMFGGLRVPIANGATVARGDKLVAGLGPSNAKGYVKALPELSLPEDLAEVAAAPTQADHNAVRTAVNSVKGEVAELSGLKGKGSVVDVNATHALLAFPG